MAFQKDISAIGHDRTRKGFDQRGLARAVIADDAQNLAGEKLKIAMIKGRDPTVALHQIFGGKNRFHQADTFLIHWSTVTARDDQHTDEQECPLRVSAGHSEAQFEDAHDQSAKKRPHDRAAPAKERNAPDHYSGDGLNVGR